MKFESSLAVITGGASGLGKAVAAHVLRMGGSACVLDLHEEAGRLSARETGAHFIRCDVAEDAQVSAAIARARDLLGGLNLLVNCAGILGAGKLLGRDGPMQSAFFEHVVRVNLFGTFHCDKAAAEWMQHNPPNEEGERGVIIHTASVAAFEGQIGQVAYAATKAAVAGMTLPIARELARSGIRCVAIAPGLFLTPMVGDMTAELQDALAAQIPFPPRLGRPEEFARLVQSIVEIPTLNGETVRLDGAIRMGPR